MPGLPLATQAVALPAQESAVLALLLVAVLALGGGEAACPMTTLLAVQARLVEVPLGAASAVPTSCAGRRRGRPESCRTGWRSGSGRRQPSGKLPSGRGWRRKRPQQQQRACQEQ